MDNLYAKQRFHYEIPEQDAQRYRFIVSLIQKIVSLYPLSQKVCLASARYHYPYKKRSEEALFSYQLNLL